MTDMGYVYFDWNVSSGDAGGTIKVNTIAADEMLQNLKDKLVREMTTDEWNYYIGKNIKQTTIKDKL